MTKRKKPDFIDAPGVIDPNAYALEIAGDSMLPVYREGDMIIVSPGTPVKEWDRVLVKIKNVVSVKIFVGEGKRHTLFAPLDTKKPITDCEKISRKDIDWIARILWASQ